MHEAVHLNAPQVECEKLKRYLVGSKDKEGEGLVWYRGVRRTQEQGWHPQCHAVLCNLNINQIRQPFEIVV